MTQIRKSDDKNHSCEKRYGKMVALELSRTDGVVFCASCHAPLTREQVHKKNLRYFND